MQPALTIGQLAAATGVATKTIRYYEVVGVLRTSPRNIAGYRQYSRHDVHRLLFIRRARALGLSLVNLKALTAELDSGQGPTLRSRLQALVAQQLCAVERQVAELQLLGRQLAQVLERLQTALPAHQGDGCRCLDVDISDGQQPGHNRSLMASGREQVRTSALESSTILAQSPHAGDHTTGNGNCTFGCGLAGARLSVPRDTSTRQQTKRPKQSKRARHTLDGASQ